MYISISIKSVMLWSMLSDICKYIYIFEYTGCQLFWCLNTKFQYLIDLHKIIIDVHFPD